MRTNNFNRIAFIYDSLVRIVFGNTLRKTQAHFLSEIASHASVLILGGGSGSILEDLQKVNPTCEIWYIDASEEMIKLSKKNSPRKQIHFICGTENDIPVINFDTVVTNFYLDLFTEEKLNLVVERILKSMHKTSIWLVTDFIDTEKWRHQLLLKLMYLFFKVTCKIESKKLPNWMSILEQHSLISSKQISFKNKFVSACVFVKNAS